MTTIWSDVRQRVEALARDERARDVFGAWRMNGEPGHTFRLAPPLRDDQVEAAEAQLGISLPGEYRDFLLQVSAGGAGPHYGLNTLVDGPEGWRWAGDEGRTYLGRLKLPCPPADESIRLQEELARREPDLAAYPDTGAYQDAWRAWQAEEQAVDEQILQGAVYLSHQGCGSMDWLVVTGPDRGHMWTDDRPTDLPFAPMGTPEKPVGFADWYLDWLERTETWVARRSKADGR